jgi:phosphohistidine phosphatase SixA
VDEAAKPLLAALTDKIALDTRLSPKTTTFITSRELRTIKAAQLMMNKLGVEEYDDIRHQSLFSDDKTCDTTAALQTVAKYCSHWETLFVITHEEMALDLLDVFCTHALEMKPEQFAFPSPSKGSGFLIDCIAKKVTALSLK